MTTNRSASRIIWLAALFACTRIAEAAPTLPLRYHVTDLGTLGGAYSLAVGISASGQVTGESDGHAFLWTPTVSNGASGTMHDLGTLGGPYSEGTGINDSGQVTGYAYLSGDFATGPFLWIPTTPNGDTGTMIDVGTLGGSSGEGRGINASGQVTGFSRTTGDSAEHAFVWTPTTPNGASGTMHDLGTLGGYMSYGDGINASGQVTGYSDTADGAPHAFLWTPTLPNGASGTMHELKTLGGRSSAGYGINDSGQVAGWSLTTEDAAGHAFLYTSGRGMVDLNSLIDPSSGWELISASAINDAGQITGYGLVGGETHAFLLTPVPEPSTLVLCALALLVFLFRYRLLNQAFSKIVGGLFIVSVVLLAGTRPTDAAIFSAASVPELIAAIDAANQNTVPDTITLPLGTTFTLTEVNNTTYGATGLPTIVESAKLTIVGNGGVIERSTADGTPFFRLIDVAPGASLALENLALQGGIGSGFGGAIYNDGTLVLDGVTVQNSIAWGRRGADCRCRPGGNGGAGGWGLGGGIYSSGSLLLENSALLNNQARGGWGGSGSPPGHSGRGGDGRGGGLFVAAGSAALYNSLVSSNSAVGGIGSPSGSGYGGGIYIAGAEVGLDEFSVAHVTGNTASTSDPNIFGPYEIIPDPNPLPGDFNGDGAVDTADFVMWQKLNLGPAAYNTWRAHFGQISGSGSATNSGALNGVPEPSTVLLLIVAEIAFATSVRARGEEN